MLRTVAKTGVVAIALISTNVTTFVSAVDAGYEEINETNKVSFEVIEESIEVKEPTEGHIKYLENEIVQNKEEEERKSIEAEKIEEYLRSRNAPLADYARVIVDAGDKYGVEPELIAAISVIESGGGKICFLSHNAWGWGRKSWSDWETAIYEYTEGLSNGYISKGIDTPSEIAPIYCPPNSSYWARNVQDQMNMINE